MTRPNHRGPGHSPTLTILRAIGLGGVVAYVLREALRGTGLSADAVVSAAVIVAVVIALFIAIEYFGIKLR